MVMTLIVFPSSSNVNGGPDWSPLAWILPDHITGDIVRVLPLLMIVGGADQTALYSGDSYSAVGYDSTSDPPPSVLHPLGVPFPGNTWNEPDLPNWVGFLITKYCHPPRFISDAPEQDGDYENSPLLVYNYAVGGDTVSGVRFQVQNRFGRDPPKVNPDESLFSKCEL